MDSVAYIETFNAALNVSRNWIRFLIFLAFPLLLVVGLRILFMFRQHLSWMTIGIRIFFGVLPLLLCCVLILVVTSKSWEFLTGNLNSLATLIAVVCGLSLGFIFTYLVGRFGEPRIIGRLQRSTRSAGLNESLTDIRETRDQFTFLPRIDNDHEFDSAAKRGVIYLGQDSNSEAVTIDRQSWKTSHVQIMGPPGTGKGIQAGVTLTQSLLCGDSVFVFDPKDDEWAPSVYSAACVRAAVPFNFVDLRSSHPQVNPIFGASPGEVEEMLYAGLELGRRGDSADFYRLDDRKAARLAASFVADTTLTLAELGSKTKSIAGEKLMTGGKAFFAALEEISELKSVQTKEGISLSERLHRGGCVYFVGSMRNEPIVVLQKMLFVRLVQLVERSRNRNRHCSIFLDEFKYLLSKPALNALGSIRDKGCNILLAHQSLGDFANCGADLNEASVRATVLDTTPIKWLYRPADSETASWISNQTGEIKVATQSTQAVRNIELSESLSATRMVGETTRNLVDMNTVMSMPEGCAVCIGTGIPRLALTEPIRVQKIEPNITIAKLAVDQGVDLLTRVDEESAPAEDILTCVNIDWNGDAKEAILRFLYVETWTHLEIICERLSQLTKEDVKRELSMLSDAKLIRSSPVSFLTDSADEVWGIRNAGISKVQETLGIQEYRKVFNKRMVNPNSFGHHLDTQRLRLKAEINGWRRWRRLTGSENFIEKGETIPDAIAKRPDGSIIAIEVERTIKNKNRYPGIMASHLHARKHGKWDEIYYFCPDIQLKKRLERAFSQITEVKYFGSTVKITEEHRKPFRFYLYDEDWF